jgi:hypothetical protein
LKWILNICEKIIYCSSLKAGGNLLGLFSELFQYGTLLAKAYLQVPYKVNLGMRGLLKKQEALGIMHEIQDVLKESVIISSVSLDLRSARAAKNPEGVGFLIRMKCDLDKYSADCLKPILDKHRLVLCEESGFVLISKTQP